MSPAIPQPLRINATVSKLGMISQTYVRLALGRQSPNSATEKIFHNSLMSSFSFQLPRPSPS